MSSLSIVTVGPETWDLPSSLRRKCLNVPLTKANQPTVTKLIEEMFGVLYKTPGIGLSAPQVGVLWRFVIMDLTMAQDGSSPTVLINPKFIEMSEEIELGKEGCLSIPSYISHKVPRSKWVKVSAFNHLFEPTQIEGDGLLARVIQHELDHLDGILFPDRLQSLSDLEEDTGYSARKTAKTIEYLYGNDREVSKMWTG